MRATRNAMHRISTSTRALDLYLAYARHTVVVRQRVGARAVRKTKPKSIHIPTSVPLLWAAHAATPLLTRPLNNTLARSSSEIMAEHSSHPQRLC
jgi:hypothetical protein